VKAGSLPRQASEWARRSLGADGRLVAAEQLRGGWTSEMWLLRFAGEPAHVLRRMVREPWRTHADGLLQRERAALGLLRDSTVPVAHSIAADTGGADAGAPSLLTTRLPGSLRLHHATEGDLTRLAAVLVGIHRISVAPSDRPRDFYSWAYPERQVVPAWATDRRAWSHAFDVLQGDAPGHDPVLMHRDFHPGNVLWDGDAITGVVDWVETSWGPAALDVAHCQTALSMLHGVAEARAFADAYAAQGGRLPDRRTLRHWQVTDIVGYLPDPAKVARPWREAGRADLADALARRRLETWLQAVLHG
jgi:aminoglycoside phosphotransferase (APT) family kinase protein